VKKIALRASVGFLTGILLTTSLTAQAVPTAKAIDGDTYQRGRTTYRLARIDAPELYGAKCWEERSAAVAARNRLQILLDTPLIETILPNETSHGRLIARLTTRDGKDVGALLIAEGHARPLPPGTRRTSWCGLAI
jgi:micrococcal nuclease